jgi:hypothetical protein
MIHQFLRLSQPTGIVTSDTFSPNVDENGNIEYEFSRILATHRYSKV